MKILFLYWNGYGNQDIIDTFRTMKEKGKDISLFIFSFDAHTPRDDHKFVTSFIKTLSEKSPDVVFSYNYFPVISTACQKAGIKYISWVYDNPVVALYSYTLINNCNYIFLFDSQMYDVFASQGIKTVYYLPLAAATNRYKKIIPTNSEIKKWGGQISFVGSLYNTKGNFYDRIKDKISPYSKGYLDGLMRAQMEIDGLNFIENSLPRQVLNEMVDALELKPNYDGVETFEYLYSNYVVNRKITSIERREIISMIGEQFPVNLFTNDPDFSSFGVNNRGQIDYYTEMPLVFKSSAINLNITLRSIQRGIPLRSMDILGCEGFLLTNYQEDYLRFFSPGEEFVYYQSRQDLMDKIKYYLEHEDDRKEIARKGYAKVHSEHTYEQRIDEMLNIVWP
jgi:spore maturation protein CgeB